MPLLSSGTATADITPNPSVVNWITGEPYDGVLDPLKLRTLYLSDGDSEVLILSWDLIDVTEEAVDLVRPAVQKTTSIPPSNILVFASHTHSSPRTHFDEKTVTLMDWEGGKQVLGDPVWNEWKQTLPRVAAQASAEAKASAVSVGLSIGRADVGEWLFNRRPVGPDGNVLSMMHPEDPYTLPDGLRFGAVDPTLTTIGFADSSGEPHALFFAMPCHPVSIYPHHNGVSADWPGYACRHIEEELGATALFGQVCAGDIVPARRGVDERADMARFFADRALSAHRRSHPLDSSPLRLQTAGAELPLSEESCKVTGLDVHRVHVSVLSIGTLAIVCLPGEALNGLAREIQYRSPVPHTVVTAYVNGRGVSYVGLPGEKSRGGYEAGAGLGADECGGILIDTSLDLLERVSD